MDSYTSLKLHWWDRKGRFIAWATADLSNNYVQTSIQMQIQIFVHLLIPVRNSDLADINVSTALWQFNIGRQKRLRENTQNKSEFIYLKVDSD